MLHRYVILHDMARGDSGRIVLEIDPMQKDELYTAIARDGLTLKDWFLRQADQYLRNKDQFPLFSEPVVSEQPARYIAKTKQAKVTDTYAKNNRTKTKTK